MRSHILILALASLGACTANFRRDVDTGDGPGDDGNNGTVTIVTSFPCAADSDCPGQKGVKCPEAQVAIGDDFQFVRDQFGRPQCIEGQCFCIYPEKQEDLHAICVAEIEQLYQIKDYQIVGACRSKLPKGHGDMDCDYACPCDGPCDPQVQEWQESGFWCPDSKLPTCN